MAHIIRAASGTRSGTPPTPPARLMELIHPGGLENGFRTMDTSEDDDVVAQVAVDYGCELDLDATAPILERYGLVFA